MIPRLYEGNETEFASLGIGELADTTSCKVTEERNGFFELELEYPESGKLFDEITAGRIILAKPNDTAADQIFRIYSISTPLDGSVTVNAEHISYMLNDIPVAPFSTSGIGGALTGIKSHAMIDCPFEFWTDIDNVSSTFQVTEPKSARACLGGSDGSILDVFSGSASVEFEFDNHLVKAWRHRGYDNGVTIDYGVNLTDLKQEQSIEDLYTGVVAYYKQSDADAICGAVQYIDNYNQYPHQRIYILDCSSDYGSDTTPTVSDLNTKAQKYIKANRLGVPKVTLTVSFVALWQTEEYKNIAPLERVSLCDTVHVNYPKLGVKASAEVIKTEYNVLTERYNSIELGDAKSSFSDTLKDALGIDGTVNDMVKSSRDFFHAAIDYATRMIQGGLGGHVVFNTNADGKPNEILIMDTDDKATAVHVLRINMNGIGFSSHGYNGPFETAWTIDGHFNASWITTGVLDAALMRTGILTDQNGSNYWNLDSGELHLSTAAKTDNDLASANDVNTKVTTINTTVDGIQSNVTQLSTDLGETKSSITQLANSIKLSVTNGTIGSKASITLSVDGQDDQTKSIDMSSVRKAFANDDSKITINAGTITFNSGHLAINSDGLTLDASGNATFSGDISASKISGSEIRGSKMFSGKYYDSNEHLMMDTSGTGLSLYAWYRSKSKKVLTTSAIRNSDGTWTPCIELTNADIMGIPIVQDGAKHAIQLDYDGSGYRLAYRLQTDGDTGTNVVIYPGTYDPDNFVRPLSGYYHKYWLKWTGSELYVVIDQNDSAHSMKIYP